MGYTTEFSGYIHVYPALNEDEMDFLRKFSSTRRMDRTNGPYFVEGSGFHGQGHDADVINYNQPPVGQPGLWCQWVPNEEGDAIEWDGGEKFYNSVEWMAYIIDHFLAPNAIAKLSGDPQFANFQPHVLNGKIYAQGEESGDTWELIVDNNVVTDHRVTREPYKFPTIEACETYLSQFKSAISYEAGQSNVETRPSAQEMQNHEVFVESFSPHADSEHPENPVDHPSDPVFELPADLVSHSETEVVASPEVSVEQSQETAKPGQVIKTKIYDEFTVEELHYKIDELLEKNKSFQVEVVNTDGASQYLLTYTKKAKKNKKSK